MAVTGQTKIHGALKQPRWCASFFRGRVQLLRLQVKLKPAVEGGGRGEGWASSRLGGAALKRASGARLPE